VLAADWSADCEVIAPVVPPVALAPWLAEAEEPLEQVSETLLMLETVITFPELELAEVPLLPA
jgi:hypothetical protein